MGRCARPRQVIVFADSLGEEPFTLWLYALRDAAGRRQVLLRLGRLAQGNFGDCKSVGEGVYELRIFFGAGYRVYFGEHKDCLVVLLCGGDKATQNRDIRRAHALWKEYLNDEKI